MKYFLTGATGFVGGRVARQLRAQGHAVVAVVRTPSKAQDLVQLGVDVRQGDVTDKESMRGPMTGVDGVYHIAGWYKIGVRDTTEAVAINEHGTRNVCELMQELGVSKGVYTSTLAVNSDTHGVEVDESYHFTGQHLSVYDRTKAAAHDIAESFIKRGLPLVIVQPGLIYGPGDTSSARDTFIQYLQRRLPVVPQRTAYSWAHIDDIAQGHIAAMERGTPGENYFICGPSHPLVDALALAQQITGVPAPRSVAPGVIGAMSSVMGVVEQLVNVPDQYSAEFLRVSAGVTYIGSNAKARAALGFAPRPLRDGLTETLHHEMQLLGMR